MSSNSRHQLLSLSLLVGMAVPWAVFVQTPISSVGSSSVGDRITQPERISNAYSQPLTQLQQQLSGNQFDIDSLRGQIRENQYQLNQVVGRQEQILLQIDNLSSGSVAAQSASSDQNGAAASTTPTTDVGTANASTPVKSDSTDTDYNAAITLVQDKSRQDDAMVAFQSFTKNYPDSTYLPNANYWLGQLSYDKDKRGDAAYYFASVVKNYPRSPRAIDAMFRVGIIMRDKGDTTKAKVVYQQVISKYPDTDSVKQAQKRLNVM